jgi:hypothetical protein
LLERFIMVGNTHLAARRTAEPPKCDYPSLSLQ